MTSVRLSLEIEEKLRRIALSRHQSKSDLIKEALEEFLTKALDEKDSYEIGKSLFGRYGSGGVEGDYKTRVKAKIRAKHHPH